MTHGLTTPIGDPAIRALVDAAIRQVPSLATIVSWRRGTTGTCIVTAVTNRPCVFYISDDPHEAWRGFTESLGLLPPPDAV